MFRIVEDNMPPLPEGCSQPLQDFLTRCFNKDPTKRPSAEMLCEHHWLKKNWGAHKVIFTRTQELSDILMVCLPGVATTGQYSILASGQCRPAEVGSCTLSFPDRNA